MNGWPMVLEWGERNDYWLSGQTFTFWFGSEHSRFITYSLIWRSLNTVHLVSISTSVLRFVYTNRFRVQLSFNQLILCWNCSHQLIPTLTLFTPTDSNTDSVHTNWFQYWLCSHQLIPTLTVHTNWFQLFTQINSNTDCSHQLIPAVHTN